MSKILITGGAGAIGSRLARQLCRDHQVQVLDDLSSGRIDNLRDIPVDFKQGSIADENALRAVFDEKPSIVYHLAARFANQNSVDYPKEDLLVNGLGTLMVLREAKAARVERFIYTSSSSVYGNGPGLQKERTQQYSIDTPYAITKLLGERYTSFFFKRHSVPTVTLRLFNSYGPGEYPGRYRNVIPNFMYRALNGQSLEITGTGSDTRDYTFVEDTVQALLLSMTRNEAIGKTYNVGTGIETSILKLARAIRDVCGAEISINFRDRRDWDKTIQRRADISLIARELGYLASVDLEAGLRRTHRWFVERAIANLKFE